MIIFIMTRRNHPATTWGPHVLRADALSTWM
jgi:hypothetical protein